MYDKITKELKLERKNLFKKSWPRLLGLTFLGAFIVFFSIALVSYTYYFSLILVFFALPLFFMVTIEVNDLVSNMRTSNISFKKGIGTYYRTGRGLYRGFRTIVLGILIYILFQAVSMGIGYFVISQTNPDIFDELKDINLGNLDAAIDFITQNSNIIYPLISVSNSVGIFAGIMFAQAEFRKNEMSFYGINTILSDNKQRISPTTMTVMIFRKELYPSVKKKHDAIDIKLNWLGYLLFFISYTAGVLIGVFTHINYVFTPMIALGLGLLVYVPFYSLTRLFDALFLVAYGEELINNANDRIKQFFMEARKEFTVQSSQMYSNLPEDVKKQIKESSGGISLTDKEKKEIEKEDKEK